jgi:hypothetical protein
MKQNRKRWVLGVILSPILVYFLLPHIAQSLIPFTQRLFNMTANDNILVTNEVTVNVPAPYIYIQHDKQLEIQKNIHFLENLSIKTPNSKILNALGEPNVYEETADGEVRVWFMPPVYLKTFSSKDGNLLAYSILLESKNHAVNVLPEGGNPSLIIGKSTFMDISSFGEHIMWNVSSKDGWIDFDCYFGNVGKYLQYRVGIYDLKYFEPYPYPCATEFIFSTLADGTVTIDLNSVKDCKINFVSVAKEKEFLHYVSFWFEDFR